MDMAVDLVSCMDLVWISSVTSTKPIPNAQDFIAVQGYIDMLQRGFFVLMPVLDDLGRAIIVGNVTNIEEVCRRCPEAAQVFWYLVHVAMENPSVRKVRYSYYFSFLHKI